MADDNYILFIQDLRDPQSEAYQALMGIIASAVDAAVIVHTGLSWSGQVDLSEYTQPAVLHATLAGDITGWTLPTPAGRAYTLELNLSSGGTARQISWSGLTAAFSIPPTLTSNPTALAAGVVDKVFLECDGVRWWVLVSALAGSVLS
jgi:hypothetical protein